MPQTHGQRPHKKRHHCPICKSSDKNGVCRKHQIACEIHEIYYVTTKVCPACDKEKHLNETRQTKEAKLMKERRDHPIPKKPYRKICNRKYLTVVPVD